MGLNQSRNRPSESDLPRSLTSNLNNSTTFSGTPTITTRSRRQSWLPCHPEVHKAFIEVKVTQAKARKACVTTCPDGAEPWYHESIAKFSEAIERDPHMKSLFDQLFLQVDIDPKVRPNRRRYARVN